MTKKQYIKRVRQLQRNMAKSSKENMQVIFHSADRINTPNWGVEITYGSHKGEKLHSYQQCWDMLKDVLGKTYLFEGIQE